MKPRTLLLLLLLLAIPLGIGIVWRLQVIRGAPKVENIADFQKKSGIPVVLTKPVRKAVTERLSLLGTVAPWKEVEVSARVGEEITSSALALGLDVARDQVVVELYDEVLAIRVRQAEGALAQAQAVLDKLRAGARTQEVKQSEARLAAAAAAADTAEKELKRVKELLGRNAIPQQKAEQLIAAYEAARAELDAARQQVSLVKEGARSEDIRAAEAAVVQARAALELAQVQVRYCRIRAPMDGTVSRIMKEPGEQTESGKPVFAMVALDPAFLDVDVPKDEIRRVRPGMPARLFDEHSGFTVEGTVAEIKPDAEPHSRTFLARIRFPNAGRRFRPGMFARAVLDLETREGALVLPKDCLKTTEEGTGVFVVTGGRSSYRTVQTGLRGEDEVEILAGLDDGAEVVLQGQKNLASGTAVDPVERL